LIGEKIIIPSSQGMRINATSLNGVPRSIATPDQQAWSLPRQFCFADCHRFHPWPRLYKLISLSARGISRPLLHLPFLPWFQDFFCGGFGMQDRN
jgi:hypothetical protein